MRWTRVGLERLEDRAVPDGTFYKMFTTEHVDMGFDYIGGKWEVTSEIGSDNPSDPAIDYAADQALHYVHPSARINRPADSKWDFIGVGSGQPFYLLPQIQNPALEFLGVAAEETPSGTFAPYLETDPRVSTSVSVPWIKGNVVAVRGPGHFSAWQTSGGGQAKVFVSSFQGGIDPSDILFIAEGAHAHYNLAFSAPGFYEVDVQASAYLGPGQTNQTVSPVTTYYFTVGDVLKVTSVTPTETGFLARFNRPIDPSTLNLFDTAAGTLGPADVTLIGNAVGAVRGSLVVPSAAIPNKSTGIPQQTDAINAVEFVRTGGPLAADTYTVTLRSDNVAFDSSKGFRTTDDFPNDVPNDVSILDGDGNGTTGDNFVGTFAVGSSSVRVIAAPDFSRGFGQAVNVPLTIDNADGVTRIEFDLLYNPDLLTVTGGTRGATVPATFTLTVDTSVPGRARVVLNGPAGLPAGTLTFANLTATVPNGALYADKHVLRVASLSVNSGAIAAKPDHGVHVAAYLGDATGNRGYSGLDAAHALRVAGGLDTGFLPYQTADPALVADVSGDGAVTAADANLIAQAVVGLAVPQLPPLPTGITPPPAGGPDPRLFIPTDLAGARGSVVAVPVRIEVTESGGVSVLAADLGLAFDPARFTVSNARTVGTLLNGFAVTASIDNTTGTVRVTVYGSSPAVLSNGTVGSVLLLDFAVKGDAPLGASALNVTQAVGTTATALNEGGLTLVPAPTNAATDATVDGTLTVGFGVAAVQVNGGAGQRSRVTQTVVTFDTEVTLDPGAFVLTRAAANGGGSLISQVEAGRGLITVSTQVVNGRTVATLTFSGDFTEFGSLADGNWTLTVDRTRVQAGGVQMASDVTSALHRLFGDTDGDGFVTNADAFQFSRAFGKAAGQPGYRADLDFDGDGFVTNADAFQFSRRFGRGV